MTSKLLTVSAAAILLGGTPAVAQTNGWIAAPTAYSSDDYRASYADAQRQAYDNGYRDGLRRGEQAARDRRTLDIEIERDYRSADNGYNRRFGDRDRYRDNYRGGFSQGYRDGYSRYGGNGAWNNRGWARNRDYRYESGYGTAGFGAASFAMLTSACASTGLVTRATSLLASGSALGECARAALDRSPTAEGATWPGTVTVRVSPRASVP